MSCISPRNEFIKIGFISFWMIPFRFVLVNFVSIYFVSFRFRFVSVNFVSFQSISFRFISFRFVSFRFRFAFYRYPTERVVIPCNERLWENVHDLVVESQALVSFKKYMPPALPYFKETSALYPFPTSPQYFSFICDPFADPIISLHSRDISLFDCHI